MGVSPTRFSRVGYSRAMTRASLPPAQFPKGASVAFIESIEDTADGPQRNMRSVFAHRPAVYAAWRQLLGAITRRWTSAVRARDAGSSRQPALELLLAGPRKVLLERHLSEAELLTLALDQTPHRSRRWSPPRFGSPARSSRMRPPSRRRTSPNCGASACPIRRSSTSQPRPPARCFLQQDPRCARRSARRGVPALPRN
jgi:hypothetical protein